MNQLPQLTSSGYQMLIGFGLGIVGLLYGAYCLMRQKANNAEEAAHDYEYKEKVSENSQSNNAEPIDSLISDFDDELKRDSADPTVKSPSGDDPQ